MTMTLIWIVTGLLLALGLVGSVIMIIPGPAIIFGAGLFFAITTGFDPVGWPTVITLGVAALLLQVVDYMAGAYGAKKYGGTRAGMIGSIIGSIIGLIVLNIIGLILGCFVGAVVGEMLVTGQNMSGSVKVGLGSVLGLLASTFIRVVASIAMITGFLIVAI